MREFQGWWFPDYETHFPEMLQKNINKGGLPVYQEPVRSRSIALCQQRRLAIDVGANVGLWSRDLCKNFAKVKAFEPVADFRECLQKNVTADNLDILSDALGNEITTAYINITPGNTGHSHIDPNTIGRGDVQIIPLDLLELEDVDYIKVDCEGYEYRVLQGAEQTVRRCRPVVVVEQKPHDAYADQYGQHAAVKMLQSWGMVKLDQVKDDWILGWR